MIHYCKILLKTNSMKTLKIIVALLILTSFTFSCTPQAVNDDDTIKNSIQATGDDGQDDTDDSRDSNG